jgi:hypothetical protein
MRRAKRNTELLGTTVPMAFRFFSSSEWTLFNRVVRDELAAQGFRIDASTPGEVRLIDEQITLGLLNLAQQCKGAPPDEWPQTVTHHVTRLGLVDDVPDSFIESADLLRVMLVPDDYLPNDVPTVHEAFAESVHAVLVADLPTSVRTISPDDLRRWDFPHDDAWRLGWQNTKMRSSPIDTATVEIGGAQLTVAHGEHFYTATHVRWLDEIVGPISDRGALVAIPRRSTMLVHQLSDHTAADAVEPMVLNARMLNLEGPRSVSAHLYWWRDGFLRWIPTTFDERDEAIEFFPPPDLVDVLSSLGVR